jgi:hypothetical protein
VEIKCHGWLHHTHHQRVLQQWNKTEAAAASGGHLNIKCHGWFHHAHHSSVSCKAIDCMMAAAATVVKLRWVNWLQLTSVSCDTSDSTMAAEAAAAAIAVSYIFWLFHGWLHQSPSACPAR